MSDPKSRKGQTAKPAATEGAAAVDFERSLEQLEQLVERLEQGDLPLEEALAAFERGVKLTRECQTALRAAEQKVEILLREAGPDGEPVPLEDD